MHIRLLTPDDATIYRALMLHAYAQHPDAFTATVAERADLPLTFWESRLGATPDAPGIVFGAFDADTSSQDNLIGVAGLSFATRPKSRHKATLVGMYVSPGARRHGVGRQLVLSALAAARARPHLKLVQLTLTQGNIPAQTLYTRCGFVPFGIEPYAMFDGQVYHSKVHMWCNLGLP